MTHLSIHMILVTHALFMNTHIHIPVYVCSIVYICKYCVCAHGPYGLLYFDIKLSIYLSMLFSVCGRKGNYLVWVRFNESLVLKVYVRDCIM